VSILLFLLGMYFLPSIVAGARAHQSTAAIFVLNMLLGWTMIGWVVALIWSLSAVWRQPTIIVQNQTPNGPTIMPGR
jgi:T4 superinfection immunity protein